MLPEYFKANGVENLKHILEQLWHKVQIKGDSDYFFIDCQVGDQRSLIHYDYVNRQVKFGYFDLMGRPIIAVIKKILLDFAWNHGNAQNCILANLVGIGPESVKNSRNNLEIAYEQLANLCLHDASRVKRYNRAFLRPEMPAAFTQTLTNYSVEDAKTYFLAYLKNCAEDSLPGPKVSGLGQFSGRVERGENQERNNVTTKIGI